MGSVIVLALLAGVGFTALFLPWVGIAGAYLIGILNPQSIWWWSFEGLRPVYWVLLPTLIGVAIMGLRGKLHWGALGNVRVGCLLVIWVTGMLSSWLGPYSVTSIVEGEHRIRASLYIMENLTKIIILVFSATLVVTTSRQFKLMSLVMLVSGLYLTWWANDRYFFNGAWGRLAGPRTLGGEGYYSDENAFGSLFVVAFAFVWYAGLMARRVWLRIGLWCCVPLIWHALFLTGSRGALLALGAVMLVIALRMKRLGTGFALMVLFAIAFVWQAGDTMKGRAVSIGEYSEDSSATGRLDAWEAGIKMMLDNPFTGVGPGAFLRAFPDYSDKKPLQAHNTLIQFGAEFGPLSLLAMALLFGSCIFSLWKIRSNQLGRENLGGVDTVDCIREAVLASIVGISVTGMFLSQQLFELMYFLIFMSNAFIYKNHIDNTARSTIISDAILIENDQYTKHALLPARQKLSRKSPHSPA